MHPTGEQVEITHEDHRVVVVEVGGGLRSYEHAGLPVLDGYAEDELAPAARGQLLIPWPNRLHGGVYTWDGVEHQVPMDEPEQQNALHGLARWRPWTAERHSASAVTMRLRLLPQPAYPFTLSHAVRYELGDDGLTVTMSATNEGDQDAPYACGAHPYITVGTERIDDALLHLPAERWLPTGPAQLPVGVEDVAATPYDFREPRPLRGTPIDHAFTDLARDASGRATLTLEAPTTGGSADSGSPAGGERGRRVEVWMDETFGYLEVFTADPLPEVARRRRGLGVEPMTSPPNAFVTGDALIRLRPGETTTASWGIRPVPA